MKLRQSWMVGSSGTNWPRLEYSRKTWPTSLSCLRLRNTSPQAQWKKLGMVPRILPWVPLPAPGAPNKRMVRYCIAGCRGLGAKVAVGRVTRHAPLARLSIFMFQLDLLDFNKGDHDLFRSVALLDLQVDIIGGNARDALGQELAARG